MTRATKAQRRARERRQTLIVLMVLALALIGSIAAWAVFFKAWTPSSRAQAPRVVLPASTGQTVALQDFLGRRDIVLVFYMFAT